MFDFDELDAALPPEVLVVYGAGSPEVNGLYQDTHLELCCSRIFRHTLLGDHLLSRERHGERHGFLIGASRRPLYGVRTEALDCPQTGWRSFKGASPAPRVEGFSTLAEAATRLADIWCQDAEDLVNEGKFRRAADVYKCVLGLPMLKETRRAEFHAFRAKTFRRLAESKKKHRLVGEGTSQGQGTCDPDDDPLHGLAAEWAIQEAEEALKLDPKCFLASWEGAIAAKHIGWWEKGRTLAKKAMQAVPSGPAHRGQRETAGTLFMLMAEEEQADKERKVQEQRNHKREEPVKKVDTDTLEWTISVVKQLNEALKVEEFKRPQYQLWKMINPSLPKREADLIFEDIRKLVWEKWTAIAEQHGYRTSWDVKGRRQFCTRLREVAASGQSQELEDLIAEIEDRTCLDWEGLPEAKHQPERDEMWAFGRREDGTWGTWNRSTQL